MLPADVLAAPPLALGVLVVSVVLVAFRAASRVLHLGVPRLWRRVLDGAAAGCVVLFAVLVVVRFLTLA